MQEEEDKMPFKSEKQRRYMHANLPEIAQRWERDYASGGIARVGYQQGTGVAPFPYQGGTIPFDPSRGNRGFYEFDELNPQKNTQRLQELGIYENLYKAPPPPMIGDKGGSMNFMSGSLDAPYGVHPVTGIPYQEPRTIADQNKYLGQTFTQKQIPWYKQIGDMFSGAKNYASGIFSGAKNKGGALVGNIMGMAMGIPGLGMLLGSTRPDNPYEKFQKQMFAEMGYQGDPNKDPFGKNIRSLKGGYDVVKQFDKLAGSKIGQKYGYAEAMADGKITEEELAEMQAKGLKGWQLNRLQVLAEGKKKAMDWYDLKNRPPGLDITKGGITKKIIKKPTSTGGSSVWDPSGKIHHGDKAHGDGGRFDISNKSSPKSSSSYSGGPGRRHHALAQGGIVSLWPK